MVLLQVQIVIVLILALQENIKTKMVNQSVLIAHPVDFNQTLVQLVATFAVQVDMQHYLVLQIAAPLCPATILMLPAKGLQLNLLVTLAIIHLVTVQYLAKPKRKEDTIQTQLLRLLHNYLVLLVIFHPQGLRHVLKLQQVIMPIDHHSQQVKLRVNQDIIPHCPEAHCVILKFSQDTMQMLQLRQLINFHAIQDITRQL